jgi:hypothetical protein
MVQQHKLASFAAGRPASYDQTPPWRRHTGTTNTTAVRVCARVKRVCVGINIVYTSVLL